MQQSLEYSIVDNITNEVIKSIDLCVPNTSNGNIPNYISLYLVFFLINENNGVVFLLGSPCEWCCRQ